MAIYRRSGVWILGLWAGLTLSACHMAIPGHHHGTQKRTELPKPSGTHAYQAHRSYDLKHGKRLSDKDQKRWERVGWRVFSRGDQLLYVVPMDHLFHASTIKPVPTTAVTLSRIYRAVSSRFEQDPHAHVVITAHTDVMGAPMYLKRLSHEQAHVVAAYLWSHGIPHDRVHIKGQGDRVSVAHRRSPIDLAVNRRLVLRITPFYLMHH